MRKDVLQSLVLWPSIASAMIGGLWLLSSTNTPLWQLIKREARSAWLQAGADELLSPLLAIQRAYDQPMLTDSPALVAPKVLHTEVPPPNPEIELVERSEQGAAAMRMPDRLTDNGNTNVLLAPRIDENLETAGLLVDASVDADNDLLEFSQDRFSGGTVDYDAFALHAPYNLAPQTLTSAVTADTTAEPHTSSDGPMIFLLEVIDHQVPEPADETLAVKRQPDESDSAEIAPPRTSVLPSSIANLADLAPRRDDPPRSVMPTPPNVDSGALKKQSASGQANPAGWPLTPQLDGELEVLASLAARLPLASPTEHFVTAMSSSPALIWSEQVVSRLSRLRSLDRLASAESSILIDELEQLAKDGCDAAEQWTDRYQQIHWLRTAYSVARRVAVWKPVARIVGSETYQAKDFLITPSSLSVQEAIAAVRDDLPETGDVEGWIRFLLLEELADLNVGDQSSEKTTLAKRFLSRLRWHGLHPAHIRWLDRPSIHQLRAAVRPWASEPVDYPSLLAQLERKETEATTLTNREIAGVYQTLRFSRHPDAVALAQALDTHYRNANVRIALSAAMLNKVMPKVETQRLPVKTRILGSRIRGVSRVDSDVDIQLNPAEDRWSLMLQSAGDIMTQSVGRNGPAAFRTSRSSKYSAATPIELTRRDVHIGDSQVQVSGTTRLRGIRTNYDGWPLLGPLLKQVVHSRYRQQYGLSNRIADRETRLQLARGIQEHLHAEYQKRSQQVQQMVLGPLGSLQLDPKVIDLQTTQQRLLARYRLAGDWQMAAFTPRPRAPRTSLMSLQIHQSALNNTLEQMMPGDGPKSLEQLLTDAVVLFGQPTSNVPEDIPADVEIQFSKTRPITIDVKDGMAQLTLRVIRLTKGERLNLTHFIVRANYRPEIEGMHAQLVREGHLRISGPRMSMRERLPARAVFNKVLSPSRKLPLTHSSLAEHPETKHLAISQLELRDGWIGLAISERDAPRIAIQPIINSPACGRVK